MNTTANLAASTADAAGIINSLGSQTAQGIVQILLVVIVISIIVFGFMQYKDRKETKKRRDEWAEQHKNDHEHDKEKMEQWKDNHLQLHIQEKDNLNERLKSYDSRLEGIQSTLKDFGKRLGDLTSSFSELSGQIKAYMEFQKNR